MHVGVQMATLAQKTGESFHVTQKTSVWPGQNCVFHQLCQKFSFMVSLSQCFLNRVHGTISGCLALCFGESTRDPNSLMGCVLWPWLVTLALAAGILEAGGILVGGENWIWLLKLEKFENPSFWVGKMPSKFDMFF